MRHTLFLIAALIGVHACAPPAIADNASEPYQFSEEAQYERRTDFPRPSRGLCDWPIPAERFDETRLSGISKSNYDKVLNQVEKAYVPIFKAKGFSFQFHRSWSDPTVNAQAWWEGSTCNVEMFGGLARYPGITSTAIRQVALHEIGHCLGGPPFFPGSMSCEGQADYYSTLVGCRELGVSCKASSLNLAKALASMGNEAVPWRPGPALPSVKKLFCDHPAAQCRLDTYDAGIGSVQRPGCWFK